VANRHGPDRHPAALVKPFEAPHLGRRVMSCLLERRHEVIITAIDFTLAGRPPGTRPVDR
jgi:hypothetical protein